jgi:hypothetical protein
MPAIDPIWIFVDKLEAANWQYFVTGSVASIFYGEPRMTHDIDVILHLANKDVKDFEQNFPLSDFYCPPEEIINIEIMRRPYGHFNLIHHETGFKADIYSEGTDPLHQWAFLKRRRISFSHNQQLWLAPPEYLILRKLEFFREGGSDKHLNDIRGMMPYIQKELDMEFLNAQLKLRQLENYWAKI